MMVSIYRTILENVFYGIAITIQLSERTYSLPSYFCLDKLNKSSPMKKIFSTTTSYYTNSNAAILDPFWNNFYHKLKELNSKRSGSSNVSRYNDAVLRLLNDRKIEKAHNTRYNVPKW